ncbi:MAG: peptide chain release factor N(5)-glutamine methyltransferase, partial [Sediminibacterium sp.]
MTIHKAQQLALLQLKIIYDEREAANITDWVLEHTTAKKRIDRLLDKHAILSAAQQDRIETILQELATHKPIQYVLGEAWFNGMKFFVNEHVLIPRPETEELVEWACEEINNSELTIKNVLDIGTGSGCIPVAIKKKIPQINITSIDISSEALLVAQKNAGNLQANIALVQVDFLNESNWSSLPVLDLIISNPPYIKQSERPKMAKNVLDFEPSIALFVKDDDALIFYRKIALFGKTHLSKGGQIFLEINETLGKEVVALYESNGYNIELRKDMQGRDRMAKTNL